MKERIRAVRESLLDENGKKLSQAKFAEKLGVSISSAQKWEIGAAAPNSAAIQLIASRCGVSEIWLRTGVGEMYEKRSRAEEMTAAVTRLMADAPDSFKAALVSTLLRFDPNGKEWVTLEAIYRDVAAEAEKKD